jgi:[protein-PII] uridylyltransferase
VHPILADMHAAGLLGAFLPEFGNLTCHMQFDSYHQYTVDEHTLIAMRNLDDVAAGRVPGLPGMARILMGVARKDLLALSLLLHDMGKYMGRGHVARGALMVQPLSERLGLAHDEEELVHFLVERHVALSDASRMRNIHEASFLKPFAQRMGTRERLDALYCMTWCDSKAVGEGILTGWQEALLGELYDAVLAELSGSPAIDRHQEVLAELVAGGVQRDEAERHLADLGFTYEHQMAAGEALRHWRVLTDASSAGIGMQHQLHEKYILFTLSLPDRHGLMADVAATLSGHGFDIIDLRTWITARGFVLYTMRLSSIYPGRLGDAPLWARLQADLLAMSQGRLDAAGLLAKRRAAIRVNKAADSGFEDHAVKVEQRTSDACTIVDVVTKDEVGLLSRLCGAISSAGCEIGYACINTMGDVAVDVFYVSKDGRKLSDADAEHLRAHMVRQLGL